MKNFLGFILTVSLLGITVFSVSRLLREPQKVASLPVSQKQTKTVRAQGYLRGASMVTIKNKYPGFVSKVYKYSHEAVKKGDVILEYNDFDVRRKIDAVKQELAVLRSELAGREQQAKLVKIDPLPSGYRNTDWKISKAKELVERTENEYLVYRKLYSGRSVSNLDMRSKKQAFLDAKAEYSSLIHDKEIISRGLAECNIDIALQSVSSVKAEIAAKEKELANLLEEQSYYKIRAVRDGIIITNSDTVDAWNDAGTSAAVVHSVKKTLVYSYFYEQDALYIREKTPARFISNQTGEVVPLEVFEVKRSRSGHAEGTMVFVKFHVRGDVSHLRHESTGAIEVDVEF
ncbi:MAG: hypothetical protein IKC77_05240 [Lentisphaeria bacterium]|nr:hypothetical protein [Lentisphaeria bacterium]